MVNDVYLHKAQISDKNKASVRLLVEAKVWDLLSQCSSSAPAGTYHLTAEFVSTSLCSRSSAPAV